MKGFMEKYDDLELLSLLLGEASPPPESAVSSETSPPGPAGPAPLSFEQRRLWFLQELTPESAAYNISSSFYLDGRLDETAVRHALAEIMRRHEVLRTCFRAPEIGDG